ncbi:hypothetical protein A3K34_02255 [candidate division WWE3 bacterium RIFOXYC1_FULL_40_10]|uniref:Carotenoid oxygenase n=1 Tax=candidate division WWE3 bacterium RIFOXYA2_FULL_46_9 TaxID=1802636 RepID=A0A1F4W1K1_UNCKA|nr:MAG: hypothetical protein A3K58_02255 [candidate division WWE3 bacterium RIFOXYB1_FULL_40_22]OGC61676.1 MAG: hypothetical protein A3K37_02255 [candidate division WWE3 bacterium RIFOXYA1_FULL_40_11]OGC63302.1 MAG: hypothetical protein A2264_02880 [candidate division WWE3 bacterium RIFOXYA2_FULL_46_9]OGC64852.1 MAG: hypothetical protein A2326_01085 [candidate division WWE3 bacterium RIFOXYB2_FULL_41_6]OGC66059.1 MAG: hypothetical protein A3K34_02255 [candidate division WWE3 bacterium RIFOXYC1_
MDHIKGINRQSSLIFDFDGTIADSFEFLEPFINELPLQVKQKINEVGIEALRDYSLTDLVKITGLPVIMIPVLFLKFRKIFADNLAKIKPVSGMPSVLWELRKRNYPLYIVTINSRDTVMGFLENNKMNMFEDVMATKGLFDKHLRLRKLMDKHGIDTNNDYYIGDDFRDILAARKVGIKVIAVSWGLNSRKLLEQYQPDFLISKPEELLNLPL